MVFSILKHLRDSLLDFWFPKRCSGCEKEWLDASQGYWCEACAADLPWIESPLCPKCGRPFPKSPSSIDHFCGDCLLSEQPFDTARSAAFHSGVVRARINQLKFGGRLSRVAPLVELLVATFERTEPEVDLVIPVPLHVRRLRQRGFNQAGFLAKGVGRRLRLPVDFGVLLRRRWSEPQTRLKRAERLQNVKGVFHVNKPDLLRDRSVLLIDDVYTTGSTMKECAASLRASGATAIHGLTVSRAVPDWRPFTNGYTSDE